MALRKHGNKRDDNEQEIIRAYREAHCSVYEPDVPCDILVGRVVNGKPRTFLIEIKSENGVQTKDQVEFQMGWRGHYAVVRTVEEALREVGIDY